MEYSLHNLMDETAHPSNGRWIRTARIAGAVVNAIPVQILHPTAIHGTVDGILANIDVVVAGPRRLKAPLVGPNQRLHWRTVAVGEASLGTVSRVEEQDGIDPTVAGTVLLLYVELLKVGTRVVVDGQGLAKGIMKVGAEAHAPALLDAGVVGLGFRQGDPIPNDGIEIQVAVGEFVESVPDGTGGGVFRVETFVSHHGLQFRLGGEGAVGMVGEFEGYDQTAEGAGRTGQVPDLVLELVLNGGMELGGGGFTLVGLGFDRDGRNDVKGIAGYSGGDVGRTFVAVFVTIIATEHPPPLASLFS